MNEFKYVFGEVWKGKSITRAYLNFRLSKECLRGKIIDIGGGVGNNYISFMNKEENSSIETFDLKNGQKVDFEKDLLPSLDQVYDTVLFLNVMEHVFNYQHIANEVVRITRANGQLLGFVPFLMWYHPDHRDFFRYTHESLQIIFSQAGGRKIIIEPIAKGPFIAMAQMCVQIMPNFIAVILFTFSYILDSIYLSLKPDRFGIYALGYYFVVEK